VQRNHITKDELLFDFTFDSSPSELAKRLRDELLLVAVGDRKSSPSNARLAATTFDLVKLGWVEALTMLRESIILEAYATYIEEPERDPVSLCRSAALSEAVGVDFDATNVTSSFTCMRKMRSWSTRSCV